MKSLKFLVPIVVILVFMIVLWAVPKRAGDEISAASLPSVPLGLKGEAAALAQIDSTFPASEAGLAAYLRVSPLNIEKVVTLFGSWEHYGNWVKGTISIERYPDWYTNRSSVAVTVKVYVDSQGWVVAYLPRTEAPAAIVMWTDVQNGAAKLQDIKTTALEEALRRVVLAAGADFTSLQGQVRYYHFKYPEAKNINIWAKVATTADQSQHVSLKLSMVQGATIFSESIFILSQGGLWRTGYSGARERSWYSWPGGGFLVPVLPFAWEPPVLMNSGLDYLYWVQNDNQSYYRTMGIAVVLIYSLP